MIPKKYNREQLIGKKCKPVCSIKNGAGECISPNTICTIKNVVRGHGLTIRTEPCEHCGQSAYITRVPRESLQLLDDGDALQYAKELLAIRTKAAQNLVSACVAVDEYCAKIGVDNYDNESCTGLDIRIWCEIDGAADITLNAIKKALGVNCEN